MSLEFIVLLVSVSAAALLYIATEGKSHKVNK